jgi:nucleotide-binding universal stress UspA family protein
MAAHPDGPLLLCYDGSKDAKHAIEPARRSCWPAALRWVLTVWPATALLGSFAWSGATASMVDYVELDRATAEDGGRVADDGVRIAQQAGLEAEPVAIKATGPVWETIIQTTDRHEAAVIVMGSRGLTGVRSMLLGSVTSAVAHPPTGPPW